MEKDLGQELRMCKTSRFWIFAPPIFFLSVSLYFLAIYIFVDENASMMIGAVLAFFISVLQSFKEKYELVLYEKGLKTTRWINKKKSVTASFTFCEIEFFSYASGRRNGKSVDLWSENRNRRTTILRFFILEMRWYAFMRQLRNHYSQWLKEQCPEKFKDNDFWHDVHESWNGELWDNLEFFKTSAE